MVWAFLFFPPLEILSDFSCKQFKKITNFRNGDQNFWFSMLRQQHVQYILLLKVARYIAASNDPMTPGYTASNDPMTPGYTVSCYNVYKAPLPYLPARPT